jgi:hypothetical protein
MTYDALLPPGDFALILDTTVPSDDRYRIVVEYADPFLLPDDLEPNDTPGNARPLPVAAASDAPLDLTVRGSADPQADYGDEDWYLLPAQEEAQPLTLRVTGEVTVELRTPETELEPETTLTVDQGSRENTFETELPAETPVLLRVTGRGDYSVALRPSGQGGGLVGLPPSPPPSLPIALELSAPASDVAAYWPSGQRLPAELTREGWRRS